MFKIVENIAKDFFLSQYLWQRKFHSATAWVSLNSDLLMTLSHTKKREREWTSTRGSQNSCMTWNSFRDFLKQCKHYKFICCSCTSHTHIVVSFRDFNSVCHVFFLEWQRKRNLIHICSLQGAMSGLSCRRGRLFVLCGLCIVVGWNLLSMGGCSNLGHHTEYQEIP